MSYPRRLDQFVVPRVPAALVGNGIHWYDFTDATTMYSDAVGTNVNADGQNIIVIRDKNRNPFCLRENLAGWMTYKVAIVNGRSVGRAAGAGATQFKHLQATVSAGSGIPTGPGSLPLTSVFTNGNKAMTAIMVVNLTADGTARQLIGDDTGGYWFSRVTISAGSCVLLCSVFDSGTNKQVSITYANSSWAVMSWRQGLTLNQMRRNGGAFQSIGSLGPQVMSNQFRLGRGFTSTPYVGDIAHLVLFPTALSDDTLLTIEKYLGGTVGISI